MDVVAEDGGMDKPYVDELLELERELGELVVALDSLMYRPLKERA